MHHCGKQDTGLDGAGLIQQGFSYEKLETTTTPDTTPPRLQFLYTPESKPHWVGMRTIVLSEWEVLCSNDMTKRTRARRNSLHLSKSLSKLFKNGDTSKVLAPEEKLPAYLAQS